jgi:hypothetical protein
MKNQDFLGLLNLMNQKPSRMDDAYMVYQLAKFGSMLDGDMVLVEPDMWLVRLVQLCSKSTAMDPIIHVISRFNEDMNGSIDEYRLMFSQTNVVLHSAMENPMDLGKRWSFVYLNDPWLAEMLAPFVRERLAERGKMLASGSCQKVSYLCGFPDIVKFELPNHQVLYWMD